ncbi:NAD(P)/FAD-dependent oxidoreductase [Kribbella solani]|uniref:phytoene desaturase family protein n=1 Tax=Kribbella solani TaxID=236067 RepID=UPI0029A5F5FB|nr:NAD(P)/FAD-dependent oxidoreductase [Kribbella solani]MDX2972244.1 NAD(P)/FAD-dependent oxidoreductase [Kribbella solani]MDX3005616.1 NAD(P)/FAD-dependent oxidoreductase [Kribbella solani]
MTNNDVLVIGAGHNGLAAAGYLARAGLGVTVLEARSLVGGASTTEEILPALRGSSCAFTVGLLRPEVINDLELKKYGLDLYHGGDAMTWTIEDGGRDYVMWSEVDETLRETRERFGAVEAEGFMSLGMDMQVVGDLLTPLLLAPPITMDELADRFDRVGAGALFDRFVTGNVRDVVERYFTDPLLRGHFAYPGLVSFFGGPSTPGSAYVFAHHSVGEFEGHFGQWGWARGGMGAIADALAASARAYGATVLTDQRVARIMVDDGRVTGVVTAEGREFTARVVISNLDPTTTMTSLLPAEHTDQTFGEIDHRGSMARVYFAADALPRYRTDREHALHSAHTFLGPDVGVLEAAGKAQAAGRLPDAPPIEVVIEGVRDPQLRDGKRYLITTGVQQLPIELADRSWDEARTDLERLALRRLEDFAPGFTDHVLDVSSLTPQDLAREYGLPGGNIYHGAMTPDQILAGRSPYRTPVAGLYLCGSGTHPGGGVMGAPGYNGAMAVLTDLELPTPRPWAVRSGASLAERSRMYLAAATQGTAAGRRLMTRLASSRTLRPAVRTFTKRKSQ